MHSYILGYVHAKPVSLQLRAEWRVVYTAGVGIFSLRHRLQIRSVIHLTPCQMDTGDSFPVGKAAGAWNWPLTSI